MQKRFDESKVWTNLTLCYYTGDDILNSHLMFNDRWWFDRYNLEGLNTYINDLTFGANVFLGKLEYDRNMYLMRIKVPGQISNFQQYTNF